MPGAGNHWSHIPNSWTQRVQVWLTDWVDVHAVAQELGGGCGDDVIQPVWVLGVSRPNWRVVADLRHTLISAAEHACKLAKLSVEAMSL